VFTPINRRCFGAEQGKDQEVQENVKEQYVQFLVALTLLSIRFFDSKFLAVVIDPSSFVRVSKRRNASSMPVRPASIFRNLSVPLSANKSHNKIPRLAYWPLPRCLGRQRKYRKNLRHDLPEQFCYFCCEWDTGITVEALEE